MRAFATNGRRAFLLTAGAMLAQGMAPAVARARAAGAAFAPVDVPVVLDVSPDRYPALAIAGDDVSRFLDGRPAPFRGFADPCIRRDPSSGELWLAYSWPHVEKTGRGRDAFALGVETHLARSRDGGASWHLERVLWPRTPARYAERATGRERDGFVSHEVPNLAYGSADGVPAWFGARLDYFLGLRNYQDREATSFCLRLATAGSPPDLADAPYATIGFAWSSPENDVDVDLTRLSPDFPVALIPNEPALHFRDGRLWLAFVAMIFRSDTPDLARTFTAVLSTQPSGPVRTWRWRYHGKLATEAEARELGAPALSQVELAQARDGTLLALVTPFDFERDLTGSDPFWGMRHRGCAVVEVASLDPPAFRRRDGRLAVRAFVESSAQAEHGPGAAAYDAASGTGLIVTLRQLERKRLAWSLHATGLHP